MRRKDVNVSAASQHFLKAMGASFTCLGHLVLGGTSLWPCKVRGLTLVGSVGSMTIRRAAKVPAEATRLRLAPCFGKQACVNCSAMMGAK